MRQCVGHERGRLPRVFHARFFEVQVLFVMVPDPWSNTTHMFGLTPKMNKDGYQYRLCPACQKTTEMNKDGYQYRLCPADQKTTEECFQAHPLDCAEDASYIQHGNHGRDVNNIKVLKGSSEAMKQWQEHYKAKGLPAGTRDDPIGAARKNAKRLPTGLQHDTVSQIETGLRMSGN